MTLRRPEDKSIAQWCLEGLNLKTVLIIVITLTGYYYTMGTRVTVIETDKKADKAETDRRFDDVARRLELQRGLIQGKVDKDAYDLDQKRVADQLNAILESQGRIESILMEHPSR